MLVGDHAQHSATTSVPGTSAAVWVPFFTTLPLATVVPGVGALMADLIEPPGPPAYGKELACTGSGRWDSPLRGPTLRRLICDTGRPVHFVARADFRLHRLKPKGIARHPGRFVSRAVGSMAVARARLNYVRQRASSPPLLVAPRPRRRWLRRPVPGTRPLRRSLRVRLAFAYDLINLPPLPQIPS